MTRGYHYTAHGIISYCNTNIVAKMKQEKGRLYRAVTWSKALREAKQLGTVEKSQQVAHLLALSRYCTADKTPIHVHKTVKRRH